MINTKKSKKQAQTSFNAKSFESVYSNIKDFKKVKDIIKSRKEYDSSYKVPKFVSNQYQKLRNEIEAVVKEFYNKFEIVGLADKLGVEIPDGMKLPEITTRIANKGHSLC